ncbi:hypothetical protein FQA39_LY06086 [Lamprigera yunnana]|nr:hypothetical protein FQA39_LY06086 [Lamprigera yunnana]
MKHFFKSVGTEITVVYVYDKVFEDILPEKLEHPRLIIDISTPTHRNSKYKIYEEILILNLKNTSLIQYYFKALKRKRLWNLKSSFRRKILIVFPLKNASELKDIFAYFFEIHIIDVIVMAHDLNGDTKMITWDPYHPSNKCGTEFNMETHSSCDLFKLKEVSENINVTVILRSGHYNDDFNSDLYVHLNPLEVCESTRSCTAPFERSVHFCTVPQRQLIDPLEVFKIVFKTQVWVLILITFILTSVIWWLIGWCTAEKTNFTSALLKVYSLTIYSAIDRVPSILSLRFIFITYVMYAIHIQSIFTANLVKLLTNDHYEPAIETLEQLAQSDLPILTSSHFIKELLNKERNDSLYMKIANKIRSVDWSEYMTALFDDTILEYNSVFLKADLLQELILHCNVKLRVISDDNLLGNHQTMFGTQIGSHLIKPMNKIVSTLSEAGLLDFKASKFDRGIKKFEYKYKDNVNNNGNSSNPKVLSLTNMYPIFVFWGMGLACATAVFIMEHICYAMEKRSKKNT